MLGATVPETSVHEDRYTGRTECDVWRARQISPMQPVPETPIMQLPTKPDFRSGVSNLLAGHASRH